LHAADGRLLPVWKLTMAGDRLPYTAVADADRVYRVEARFFDVDGTAQAYPHNDTEAKMSKFDLPGLIGDGTLTSTYLTTVMADGRDRADNADHNFVYDAADPEYPEVAAYVHAQAHLDFFTGLGFKWYGPKPLSIRVHDQPRGETNNALFVPAGGTNATPTILLGDGDGTVLTNLGTDGDVVSHELGHFIIYQSLTSTDGESLVLHEGLADFFAFARTGDPCLGESICPAGSESACWPDTAHECLRTAATDLTYGSDLWESLKGTRNRLGHLHGQAISGLLWDLRKSGGVPAADLTKIVFGSIDFLGEASGFRDFLISLLLADKEQFDSQYFAKIKAAAEARGFTEFVDDIESDDTIPEPSGDSGSGVQAETTSSSGSSKSSSDHNPLSCGVLPGGGGGNALALLLLLLLPLAGLRPAAALAKARSRKARRRDR
jgi:hypothetical protein